MKRVRLIRHGESAANAGLASRDHATIPLTSLGVDQAWMVAGSFSVAPDLIVTSPFARAQATAQATATIFPSTTTEIWPIQEFTYLEPARCADTTVAQRKRWVDAYWLRSDPAYRDGVGSESFIDFISRVQAFLVRLAQHQASGTVVFSHGQFLNTVAWLLEKKPQALDSPAMADWRNYEIENHLPNGGGFWISKENKDDFWILDR
ncbi:histidine phosphatase family protein [Pseudomonas sp. TYF_14]|uniref:histidine phosphatase family protein n=1 Tax=Pseudomonas sp. TYF_14 TaxID=3367193 RepID=UPI003709D330